VTFAYRVGCVSDVSPITLKLRVIENGEKYILRGETLLSDGEGGKYKPDPKFKKWPKELAAHAKKRWRKHSKN